MSVDILFKIAAIGIIVSILNLVLKHSGREEQAMLTTIIGLVIVLMIVAKELNNLFNAVKTMFNF